MSDAKSLSEETESNVMEAQTDEEASEQLPPKPRLLPYKSFLTTLEELPEFLKEHGVAVIPAVLDADEVKMMQAEMWELLATLSKDHSPPIQESDPLTWSTIRKFDLMHGMLFHGHGVAHSKVAWRVRQTPAVAAAFARIWGCAPEDLITSFRCPVHPSPS